MTDQTKAADLASSLRSAVAASILDGRVLIAGETAVVFVVPIVREIADLLESQAKRIEELEAAHKSLYAEIQKTAYTQVKEESRSAAAMGIGNTLDVLDAIREKRAVETALTLTPEKIEAASRAAGLPCTSRGDDLAKAALLAAGLQEPEEQP